MVHWQQADGSGAYVSRQLSSDEETPRYSPGRTASIFIQERSLGLYGTAGSAEQLAPLHIEAVAEREASKPQLRCIFVLQMLVCMEIPSTKLEELPGPLRVEALTQKIQLHREKYLQENRSELGFTAEDVKDSFRVFSNTHKAFGRCLRGILGIQHSQPLEQKLDELTDMFFEDVTEFSSGYTPGSVAVAVLLYQLAPVTKVRQGPMLLSPAVRLFANHRRESGKTYLDAEACGPDMVLAANRMPAYWRRLEGNLEKPACEDDASVLNSLAVASPPVICWICGEGFRNNLAHKAHCEELHGDYAEYRKRLFWRAQQDGFQPMLPWVKRHILQSASFHLGYSVPGACSLKWCHPDSFIAAMPRAEVPCVVCARKDWIEMRFQIHLWREADGSSKLSELCHVNCGQEEFLTCDGRLCFGEREKVNEYLSTAKYAERMPMLPKDHLYASSVIHPEDHSMSWLLHTRAVPMQPNSRQPCGLSAGQPAGGGSDDHPVEAEAAALSCAGVGDPNGTAWVCYECANCLCKPEQWMKMPEYALANLLFLGRLHPLMQEHGTLGLRLLLGLGIPCFRKVILGKGNKEERESGLLGNHVLLAQAAAQMGDVLPPSAESLSNNFVALFGRSPEQVEKCQILKVNRQAYVALVKERAQTNPVYHDVVLDNVAVADIPEDGVPPQILACACPLVGSDRYRATRIGPGTFRDPMDKSQGDEENIGRGHGRRRAMC